MNIATLDPDSVVGFMGFENVSVTGLLGPMPVIPGVGVIRTTVGGVRSTPADVVKHWLYT